MPNHWYRLACLLALALFSAPSPKGVGQAPKEKRAIHQVRVQTNEVVVDVGVTRIGIDTLKPGTLISFCRETPQKPHLCWDLGLALD